MSWTIRAFGLTVRGDFPAPGLDGHRDPPGDREVRVSLGDARQLGRQWFGHESVCERKTAAGQLVMRIDRAASGEYRILAPGYGTFVVTADGRRISAAPQHPSAWRWQRYLIGQALPLAALLQGVEILHASAVVMDGRAVALAGASYSGKTTLAMALVEAGAELLCDDVLAVEPYGTGLLAHPGPAVVNLRHGAAAGLSASSVGLTELGRDEEAIRLGVQARASAAPLAALYVLHRGSGDAEPVWERPAVGEAALLLASTFNLIVLAPDRLRRQLDVCARLANCAEVMVLRVPAETTAPVLARAIAKRFREGVSCAA